MYPSQRRRLRFLTVNASWFLNPLGRPYTKRRPDLKLWPYLGVLTAGFVCSVFLVDTIWAKVSVGWRGVHFWVPFALGSILIVAHQIAVFRVGAAVRGLGNALWLRLFREEFGPPKARATVA
jgi:hypothetical protein